MSSKLSLHGQAQNEGIKNPITPADSISYLQAITAFSDLNSLIRSRKMQMLLPVEHENMMAAMKVKIWELVTERRDRREDLELAGADEQTRRQATIQMRAASKEEYRKFYEDRTSASFEAAWADPILSSNGNTMKFKQLGLLRFGDHIVECGQAVKKAESTENAEEILQTSGCLFFDGTALKSIITATSTQVGSEYLQAAAKLFSDPNGQTAQWIKANHPYFTCKAYSAGGDEIIMFFKSEQPVNSDFLDEVIARFQDEVKNSPALKAFVDFENPENLMRYGNLEEEEKIRLRTLPLHEQQAELVEVRKRLPDHFTPHFSGGYGLLGEALHKAIEHDHRIPENTEEGLVRIERVGASLVEVGDVRQRENKRKYKKWLRENDPQQWFFMIRTDEAERYAKQVLELEEEVKVLKQSGEAKDKEIGKLNLKIEQLDRYIEFLEAANETAA